MNPIFFDIETEPLPESELLEFLPPFDETEVRCGNIKDPDKIREKIEAARAAHKQDFLSRAALHPMTGKISMIGVGFDHGKEICDSREEISIGWFWNVASPYRLNVGFNILAFDLPFIVRRSWRLGVPIPDWVRTHSKGRTYWDQSFVDLREEWLMGDRQPAKGTSSLEAIAKFLGLGGKGDPCHVTEMNREQLEAHLRTDLELTEAVWRKLHGVSV